MGCAGGNSGRCFPMAEVRARPNTVRSVTMSRTQLLLCDECEHNIDRTYVPRCRAQGTRRICLIFEATLARCTIATRPLRAHEKILYISLEHCNGRNLGLLGCCFSVPSSCLVVVGCSWRRQTSHKAVGDDAVSGCENGLACQSTVRACNGVTHADARKSATGPSPLLACLACPCCCEWT